MKKEKEIKKFNIIILGTGGQGLITLARIITVAAFLEGYEARMSELHGLSQRGGSVKVDVRFGENIFSPLVSRSGADLILVLEAREALNGIHYLNKETVVLINNKETPIFGKSVSATQVLKVLKKFTEKIYLIEGSEISRKHFGKEVFAGIILLKKAREKSFLPLKKESLEKAVKMIFEGERQKINLKILSLEEI